MVEVILQVNLLSLYMFSNLLYYNAGDMFRKLFISWDICLYARCPSRLTISHLGSVALWIHREERRWVLVFS